MILPKDMYGKYFEDIGFWILISYTNHLFFYNVL